LIRRVVDAGDDGVDVEGVARQLCDQQVHVVVAGGGRHDRRILCTGSPEELPVGAVAAAHSNQPHRTLARPQISFVETIYRTSDRLITPERTAKL